MIVKFKTLDIEEKVLVIVKLGLCFFAGVLFALLIFRLLAL
jgi:hypothetical protein